MTGWNWRIKRIPSLTENGRTGRLLVNLELMKAGYLPIDIQFTDRIAHYNALIIFFPVWGRCLQAISMRGWMCI